MNELLTMLRVLIYYLETRKSKNRNESDTKNRFLVCSDKGMTNPILFTLTKTLMFKNRTHKLEMPLGTTYYTVHITSISFLHAKDLLALICSSLSPNVKLNILESSCIFYSTIPLSKTIYPLCKRFWWKIYLSSNTLRLAQ